MSLSRIIVSFVTACTVSFAAFAQQAPAIPAPAAGSNAPITRDQLPALVKEVLMNEPEMVMEAVEKLREKQRVEAEQKTKAAIAANKSALYLDPGSPSVGNMKDPDITIVEFFDYHCGYCKHMLPVISKLVEEDKKVRVVFKEFPILSDDSVKASRAGLAVHRIAKDKYFAFHTELMNHKGKFDEKVLTDLAKKAGIDAAAMVKEMTSDAVTAELDKTRKLGEDIGVRGTPALILNDYYLAGATDLEGMKKMIANVRAGKSPEAEEEKPEEKPAS